MASIYKRRQDRGKRRACWYIGYTDHRDKRRMVRGFSDKSETERLAAKLEEEARQIRQGLKSPDEPPACRRRPLASHVDDFETQMRSRDVTGKHVAERCGGLAS